MSRVFLYFPGERLSAAELSAACLDGHLVGLGEGYVPADTVETPGLRAASLAELAGADLAAVHESAAWVHGVLDDPPARHRLQRISARRLHEPVGRRFVYRDPRVPESDLTRIAGLAVTTPARTVADLARSTAPESRAVVARYISIDPDAVREALQWFAGRGRVPRKRPAQTLLAELLRTT